MLGGVKVGYFCDLESINDQEPVEEVKRAETGDVSD